MFVGAVKVISAFTQPVIILKRLELGKVESDCATFLMLNSDGWILTAAHVLDDFKLFEQQKAERKGAQILKAAIRADKSLNDRQKELQISQISRTPNHIMNISYWWQCEDTQMGEIILDDFVDLAAIRIVGLPPLPKECYPIFKNLSAYMDDLPMGRSLCRLGFPSQEIRATYDEAEKRFILAPGNPSPHRSCHDGVFARDTAVMDEKRKRTARFIETSIPGLQGQSGGPIFDAEGCVWGIESQVTYSSSGISPRLRNRSPVIPDHSFRNVGIGVHASEVIAFLRAYQIDVNVSNN